MNVLLVLLETAGGSTAHEGGSHDPYWIGGGVLVLLLALLLGLMAFGKGREHS